MNIKKYIAQIVFIVIAILSVVSLPSTASAADLMGSAWSGNVGWITFNCATNGTCGTNNSTAYKVSMTDTTGFFWGYAWNDSVGWIKFDDTLTTACPPVSINTCKPSIIGGVNGSSVSGYARALSGSGVISTAAPAEFTGWIDLYGAGIQPNYVNGKRYFSGYAWGGDVIGWIDMSGVYVVEPVKSVTLTPAGSTVAAGSNVSLSWTAPGYQIPGTTCTKTASPANTAWSGTVTPPLSAPVSGTQVVTINTSTTFTISCTNAGVVKTASQTFTVNAPASVTLNPASQVFSGGVVVPLSWTSSNFPTTGTTTCVGTTSGFSNPNWTTSNLTPVASGSRGVTMSTSAGAYTYTITCTNGAVSRSASQTYTVLAPTVTLSANPTSVSPGGTTYLTWSSTNANTGSGNTTPCTATKSGGTSGSVWSGSKSASGNAVSNVVGTTSATYTLICYNGATASVPATVTVNVITPPPTVTLTATPTSVSPGGTTYLTWSSTNASSCTAGKNGGVGGAAWNGLKGISGSNVSNVVGGANATYSMTCFSNITGLTSAPASVTVSVPPPTATISANPTSVNSGGATRLTWSSTNATGCNVSKSGGAGGQSWTGTAPTAGWVDNIVGISPATSATYTITCSNGSVTSAPSSVSVNISAPVVPTVTFNASPTSVTSSSGVTRLTWSSTNADSCSAVKTGGAGGQSWTGTAPTAGWVDNIVGSSNATYTVTCYNGTVASTPVSRVVTVSIPVVPTVTLSASPTTVNSGGITRLSWSSTNAALCQSSKVGGSGGSSWTGPVPVSGSNFMNIVGSTAATYSIICYNGTLASAPAYVDVWINTPIVTPTVDAWAVPASVKSGENIKIYWTSTNSNPGSCIVSNLRNGENSTIQPQQMNGNPTPPAQPAPGYSTVINETGNTTIRVTCTNSTYGTSGYDDLNIQVDPLTKKIKVIER